MGEVMIDAALSDAGVENVVVESAGTGDWHVGGGADHRAEQVIARAGLDLSGHVVSQFRPEHFDRVDLVIAMDNSHVRDLRAMAPDDGAREKVRLLRSFDPEARASDDLEVADPYYGDFQDFEVTYDNIDGALAGLVDFVKEQIRTSR